MITERRSKASDESSMITEKCSKASDKYSMINDKCSKASVMRYMTPDVRSEVWKTDTSIPENKYSYYDFYNELNPA